MKLQFTKAPPLSLYVHIPWCVKKCPYCDFNSHAIDNNPMQESRYIDRLILEFEQHVDLFTNREIHSIFIGGGTPSLFSATSLEKLLTTLNRYKPFKANLEITMEANPGTIEQQRFKEFFQVGINRLSIGIQSFQDDKLKQLGRIHSAQDAINVAQSVRSAGFTNFNLDLMYGLPNQSVKDALFDLETALAIEPTHLSWYQLTIEPNTVFYKQRPVLPHDDLIIEMESQGRDLLNKHNFNRYEISAYCQNDFYAQHNLNYWYFGDYLGIGAGAHSKITDTEKNVVKRFHNIKQPNGYLAEISNAIAEQHTVVINDIIFEFMLNSLRLLQAISFSLFEANTGLSKAVLLPYLNKGANKALLTYNENFLQLTDLGNQFLNDVIELFLADESP